MRKPVTAAALSVLLALSVAACSSGTKAADNPPPATTPTTSAAPATADGISCEAAGDLNATPTLKPPANFPIVSDGHLYLAKGPFGKTELFFVWKQADPTKLDQVRDEAANLLVQAGYKLERKDQEEGSEAEAHLSGKQDVAIQVIQLCSGRVRVKYQLG